MSQLKLAEVVAAGKMKNVNWYLLKQNKRKNYIIDLNFKSEKVMINQLEHRTRLSDFTESDDSHVSHNRFT